MFGAGLKREFWYFYLFFIAVFCRFRSAFFGWDFSRFNYPVLWGFNCEFLLIDVFGFCTFY